MLTKIFLAVAWVVLFMILSILAFGMLKKGHAVTAIACMIAAMALVKEAISFLVFRKEDGARGLGTQ